MGWLKWWGGEKGGGGGGGGGEEWRGASVSDHVGDGTWTITYIIIIMKIVYAHSTAQILGFELCNVSNAAK